MKLAISPDIKSMNQQFFHLHKITTFKYMNYDTKINVKKTIEIKYQSSAKLLFHGQRRVT